MAADNVWVAPLQTEIARKVLIAQKPRKRVLAKEVSAESSPENPYPPK